MEKRFQRDWFRGKKIIVLGLARSGLAVSKLLLRFGAKVIVNDQKDVRELAGAQELRERGATIIAGRHPDDLIDSSVDLVVKNPGIPYASPPVQRAERLKIPVITEIELAYAWTDADLVAITGTNGKTTTTSLVGDILRRANKRPIVAGNIGTVLCEKAVEARENDILVAELSSFQLKGTIDFRPRIASLLNVSPAHLDYHETWDDYVQSKAKLFANMSERDLAVLNADSEVCQQIAKGLSCDIAWFSARRELERGTYVRDGIVYARNAQGEERSLISAREIAMPGAHNLENALAAAAICDELGVSPQVIRQSLVSFQGVEHRLEYVASINGIKFYNNSKATNSEATMRALESFEQPIVLIAGGLDRGDDFEELIPYFKQNVKAVVAYGQTKQKFIKIGEIAGIHRLSEVDHVEEAVDEAMKWAASGDIVLLSPSCASWDMHRSFEERGSIFKESVHKLKTSLH